MMQDAETPTFYIYEIRHKVSQGEHKAGECLYAGVSKHPARRWRQHKQEVARGKRSPKACALRKYGVENFELVTVRGPLTREEADTWEIAQIAVNRELGEAPSNISDGGNIGDVLAAVQARAALPPEVRSDIARKRAATLGPEGCRAAARKANATLGPERRSAIMRKAKENMGPERRRAAKRKADETLGPERRSAAARKRAETLGPEGRSAAMRKRAETLGPEGRSAAARKAKENMGPERRRAAARKRGATLRLLKQLGFVNKSALETFLILEPEHRDDYVCLGLL